MDADCAQSYAYSGGYAEDMYILQNYGSFSDLYFLQNLQRLQDLQMVGNTVYSLDGLQNCASLRRLELNGNAELKNINIFAEITSLEYIYLAGSEISEGQVEYVKAANPLMQDILSTDNLTGQVELTMEYTELKQTSVMLSFSAQNASGIIENGIILTSDNVFNFDNRLYFGDIIQPDLYYKYEYTGLEMDSDYVTWFYIIDENESRHISPACAFHTPAEESYQITMNATYPAYEGSGEYGDAPERMFALIYRRIDESQVTSDIYELSNAGDNTWTYDLSAGQKYIMYSNIDPHQTTLRLGFTGSENTGISWNISQERTDGIGQDILLGTGNITVPNETSHSVEFVRPVARLSLSLEIQGNYPLDNISEVLVEVDNCYDQVTVSTTDNSINYAGNITNSFRSSEWYDRTIVPASGEYIFPNVEGTTSTVYFTIFMKDGTSTRVYGQLPEPMVANHGYSYGFWISWNESDNTFTIDDIEFVDDEIEF